MHHLTHHLDSRPALRRWLYAALLVAFASALWGIARDGAGAATASVSIKDFSFQPSTLTVRVGDTVTWTNGDGEAHAVQGGPVSSPDIPPGGSFSSTFDEVGDVDYICRLHTYMSGTVHVESASAPTTAPPEPTTTTAPPPPSTTTTTTPGATTTTAPGVTTTTTAPSSTTSTTNPPSSGDPAFQDVPDDPSATFPPGSPGATTPPPTAAPTTTTTSPPTSSTAPPAQDVPGDDDAATPPGGGGDPGAPGGGPAAPTDLGDGTVLAPSTDEGGVKVFRLTMAPKTIEVAPGVTKEAYAFNGTVPGPVLRVAEGDRVRIIVRNDLSFPTAVHWHGMILPNEQDGVPGVTQPFIDPGEQYTYEWTAVATGTHWYHSHSSGRHIGKGLYGGLEVVPKAGDFSADRDYRLLLGDSDLGFVLNGRMFPSTTTLVSKVGESVRLRIVNAGDQVHAMHLHGVPFDVVAQDGNRLAVPLRMDTLTISPGQTYDLLAEQVHPGKWLLHCHIFAHSHKSGDDHEHGDSGMTGMVTMLDVAPADAELPASPLVTQSIASTGTAPSSAPPLPLALLALTAVVLTGAGAGVRGRALLVARSSHTRKEVR